MKIYDTTGNILENPDLAVGRLIEDRIFIAHHEAAAAIEEQWHYETVAEYPNGGKDIQKIIDVPGVEAQEAWDEYEDIYRYIPYTEAELKAIEESKQIPTTEERLEALEAAMLELIIGGVQ